MAFNATQNRRAATVAGSGLIIDFTRPVERIDARSNIIGYGQPTQVPNLVNLILNRIEITLNGLSNGVLAKMRRLIAEQIDGVIGYQLNS